MEIVYFVLGVVTILLVIGVVVVVRVNTLVRELKEDLNHHERETQDVVNDIYRRIEDERREVGLQINDTLDVIREIKDVLHKRIDDEVKDIQSQLDSRLDKFENKINKQKSQLLKG